MHPIHALPGRIVGLFSSVVVPAQDWLSRLNISDLPDRTISSNPSVESVWPDDRHFPFSSL